MCEASTFRFSARTNTRGATRLKRLLTPGVHHHQWRFRVRGRVGAGRHGYASESGLMGHALGDMKGMPTAAIAAPASAGAYFPPADGSHGAEEVFSEYSRLMKICQGAGDTPFNPVHLVARHGTENYATLNKCRSSDGSAASASTALSCGHSATARCRAARSVAIKQQYHGCMCGSRTGSQHQMMLTRSRAPASGTVTM